MHCTWNGTRRGKDNVPTVIKIDEVLDEKKYCNTCWTWLFNTDIVCPSCGKKDNLSSIGINILFAPTLFFIISNFIVWLTAGGAYPYTLAGLLYCYEMGIPF